MLVSDFNYHLPEELIAQQPLPDRGGARMLHLVRSRQQVEAAATSIARAAAAAVRNGAASELRDAFFRDLPELLRPDDLVVFNNTRVFPARLFARRSGERAQPVSPRNPASREFLRGRVEVLLTRQSSEHPEEWQALVRPGRKIGVGERLSFFAEGGEQDGGKAELEAEVIARGDFGERTLRFVPVSDFFDRLERIGHVPLPPYIARADEPADRERYQTVYAHARGSVAAPTAGLHFTPEILARLAERGIETAEITLHVGLGTFQPVHAEQVEDHQLHRERFQVSEAAAAVIRRAAQAGRRIVAVGTTTVRTLEYCARQSGGEMRAGSGEADIFIYPGFQFRVVGALLTNFHLPQSTLLMLVAAFAGREPTLAAYAHAVRERYRFYSYGDCMLIE